MLTEEPICVIGAGPAGSTAALRLRQLGHAVVLVDRGFPSASEWAVESIAAAVLPLLEQIGLREAFLRKNFLRSSHTVIRWAGATEVTKLPPEHAAFLVLRPRFHDFLRRAAEHAGVKVIRPALAAAPIPRDDGGWNVPLQIGAQSQALRAQYIVFATGRSPFHANVQNRLSKPTLALCASGDGSRSNLTVSQQYVEATQDGWLWATMLPDNLLHAAVVIDPTALCAGTSPQRALREALARSELLSGASTMRLLGPVRARPADPRRSKSPIGRRFIRIGDAVTSSDPLSAQGVVSAMASALQASLVAHSLHRTHYDGSLADSSAAIAYYKLRTSQISQRHSDFANAHYARQAKVAGAGRFWRERCLEPVVSAPDVVQSTITGLQLLVLSPTTRIMLARESSLAATPCLVGDHAKWLTGVQHPALSGPVAFVDGIEIGPMLGAIPMQNNTQGDRKDCDDTVAELIRRHAPVQSDKAWNVLQYLASLGVIVPAPCVYR